MNAIKPPLSEKSEPLAAYQEAYTNLKKWFDETYLNKEVTLINCERRARGRAALITGFLVQNGELLFLCMVARSGTEPKDKNFLNGPVWSRSYRTRAEFLMLDK